VRYGGVVRHEAAETTLTGAKNERHASWGEPHHRLTRSLLFASLWRLLVQRLEIGTASGKLQCGEQDPCDYDLRVSFLGCDRCSPSGKMRK
jgi:hypothetical protein